MGTNGYAGSETSKHHDKRTRGETAEMARRWPERMIVRGWNDDTSSSVTIAKSRGLRIASAGGGSEVCGCGQQESKREQERAMDEGQWIKQGHKGTNRYIN